MSRSLARRLKMGKANNEGQALSITASLAVDTNWNEITPAELQAFIELPPKERGARFAAFLRNAGRPAVKKVLSIVKEMPSLVQFIGRDCKIIPELGDCRADKITGLVPANIFLLSVEKPEDRDYTHGDVLLGRVQASGLIRLGIAAFFTLWFNQDVIPASWKKSRTGNGEVPTILFAGTVMRTNCGREILCLSWDRETKKWRRFLSDLESAHDSRNYLYAVL